MCNSIRGLVYKTSLAILSVLIIFSTAAGGASLCKYVYEPEVSGGIAIAKLAKIFGYSPSVLRRIRTHRPWLYTDLVNAAASKDKQEIEKRKPKLFFRGMAVLPENYNPEFAENFNITDPGQLWFSPDLLNASIYSGLQKFSKYKSYRELYSSGYRHFGLTVAVQMPPEFSPSEGRTRSTDELSDWDFSIRREDLGNESDLITAVYIYRITNKGDATSLQTFTYEEFKTKFGKNIKNLR